MQLIVITTGSYPYGGAATNRHMSYLKGLANLGVKIKMIVLQQDNKQSQKSNIPNGSFEGVEFVYARWLQMDNNSILKKVLNRIAAHKQAINILKTAIDFDPNSKALILIVNPIEIMPYLIFLKMKKISVYHERTEFPFLELNTLLKKIIYLIYISCIVPKFSGIFVISKALVEYFKNKKIKENKILHLPMTVDLERFEIEKGNINPWGKYIAYCGSMYTDKDGVPVLIDAFNIIANNFNEVNLVLIGDNSDQNKFEFINKKIDQSPFKSRIFVTGWIERDQMPILLKNATLLALARPDNIQAKGGFPTKLGEYLATGNPVVITDVGEHKLYLKDKYSAFISKPDCPIDFAKKLKEALSENQLADMVGKNGKKIAEEYFNSNIQSKLLFDFIYGDRKN